MIVYFTSLLKPVANNISLETNVGIRKNVGNQHFLHFPQYLLPIPIQILAFNPY